MTKDSKITFASFFIFQTCCGTRHENNVVAATEWDYFWLLNHEYSNLELEFQTRQNLSKSVDETKMLKGMFFSFLTLVPNISRTSKLVVALSKKNMIFNH